MKSMTITLMDKLADTNEPGDINTGKRVTRLRGVLYGNRHGLDTMMQLLIYEQIYNTFFGIKLLFR